MSAASPSLSAPSSQNPGGSYRSRYVLGVLLCLVGAAVGLRLPDFDRALFLPPLVVHRSLLTHGFLLPLLLFSVAVAADRLRPEGATAVLSHAHADPRVRLLTIGFCAGIAAHLCFDLFPRAWWGWALVYAPIAGRLSAFLSVAWLLLSALLCLYLGCRLLRNLFDLALGTACVGAGYGLCAANEPNAAVYALLTLALLSLVAFLLSALAARYSGYSRRRTYPSQRSL